MAQPDLFSALSKYDASNSPENYLTEVFAFLLRHMLAEEPAAAVALLNNLCGADDAFKFKQEDCPRITVETQVTTGQGRPDMAIRAPGHLAYVEAKKDSPLSLTQTRAYLRALDHSDAGHQRLVVLTKYAVDTPDDPRVRRVRWFEVHDWLTQAEPRSRTSRFLVGEFTRFLGANRMKLERVGWELMPGVDALTNFRQMLDAAVEHAGLKDVQGGMRAGLDFVGCTMDTSKFWCGLEFQRPLRVWFQGYKVTSLDQDVLKAGPHPLVRRPSGYTGYALDLEDEEVAFFAKGKEKQLSLLADFIKKAYDAFKKAEATAATGRSDG